MSQVVKLVRLGRGGARVGAGRPRGAPNRPERSRGSFAYVICEEGLDGVVKFGMAYDPLKRLAALQVANHRPLCLVATIEANNEAEAAALEASLHQRFKPFHLRGEWFAVSVEDAVSALNDQARLLGVCKSSKV